MNNCVFGILVILGLLSLGWIPIWLFRLIKKHQKATPSLAIQKIKQLVLGALILIACYQIVSWLVFHIQLKDRQRIDFLYLHFRENVIEERFEEAYLFMSPQYRQIHSFDTFKKEFCDNNFPRLYPYRYLSVFMGKATLYPDYDVYGDFWQNATKIYWEKVDGEWYLTGEIGWILD